VVVAYMGLTVLLHSACEGHCLPLPLKHAFCVQVCVEVTHLGTRYGTAMLAAVKSLQTGLSSECIKHDSQR
jgi:hypothetical protein